MSRTSSGREEGRDFSFESPNIPKQSLCSAKGFSTLQSFALKISGWRSKFQNKFVHSAGA